MRLRKAYTIVAGEAGPSLVLEFDKGGPAVVDCYGKATLVNAGIIVLHPLDDDQELEGFETLRLETEPGYFHEFAATGSEAATRDPVVVKLTRDFLASVDDFTFRPEVQVYPRI